jgi:hypothetical protein
LASEPENGMTPEQWWAAVDENWSDLEALISDFHPANWRKHNHPITAPAAEEVCEDVRTEIRAEGLADPVKAANNAMKGRDAGSLHTIFEHTWFGLPESYEIRSLPGFGVLCDLCSEIPEEFMPGRL